MVDGQVLLDEVLAGCGRGHGRSDSGRRCNAFAPTVAALRHGHGCIPIENSMATSATPTTIVT
jgi:hypothetical protein